MKFEIQAESRDTFGRSDARRMRRLGRVPAIVYGADRGPEPISLDHNTVLHQMEQEAFYTSILAVKVGSDTQSVVVKEVQRHPAKRYILHMDFQRIVESEELTLHVPIHFLHEETAKGVKLQGGFIEHLMTDIEITCLPKDLPEYIEVDVAALELNDVVHLSEVTLPEGVTSVALMHETDPPLVTVTPPRREEEEAEPAEAVEPGEVPAAEAGDEDEDSD